jgi:hypothetical protein
MHASRTTALLGAVVSTAALLVAAPASVDAATGQDEASARVVWTPERLRVSPDLARINLRVVYRCRNTTKVTYYLTALVTQADVPETHYSIGFRGEAPLLTARCTGRRVTQTLRLARSWWYDGNPDPQPRLHPGLAQLEVELDARGATAPGSPGWYEDLEPDALVTGSVRLLTPPTPASP